MPTYDAMCHACHFRTTYVRPVAQCEEVPTCPICEMSMAKVILSAPAAYVTGSEFRAFRSCLDGTPITSPATLAEHNRRNNVVNLNEGYSDEDIKNFSNRDFTIAPDKEEIKRDTLAAIDDCKQGYKPQRVHEETLP